jgi:Carbohydrate phosphorylase
MSTKTVAQPRAAKIVPVATKPENLSDLLGQYRGNRAGTRFRPGQRLADLYANGADWARKVILNLGTSGEFSGDRTIHDYATQIWRAEPCPIV